MTQFVTYITAITLIGDTISCTVQLPFGEQQEVSLPKLPTLRYKILIEHVASQIVLTPKAILVLNPGVTQLGSTCVVTIPQIFAVYNLPDSATALHPKYRKVVSFSGELANWLTSWAYTQLTKNSRGKHV